VVKKCIGSTTFFLSFFVMTNTLQKYYLLPLFRITFTQNKVLLQFLMSKTWQIPFLIVRSWKKWTIFMYRCNVSKSMCNLCSKVTKLKNSYKIAFHLLKPHKCPNPKLPTYPNQGLSSTKGNQILPVNYHHCYCPPLQKLNILDRNFEDIYISSKYSYLLARQHSL